MTCDHCARSVEKALTADGILKKEVSYPRARGRVTFDPARIDVTEIEQLVNHTGHYHATGITEYREKEDEAGSKHLVIIGGGSAAFAATTEAVSMGARVTMINDGLPIGGTCVNVGCVPSKNLIRAAETLHKANHNPFKGIHTRGRLEDFKTVIEEKRQLVNQLRTEKYIDVVKDLPGFRLIEGRARFISSTQVRVNDEILQGDAFLIATGARPALPDIPGLNEVDYLTSESAFELEELPESLLIIGGRYIALELAQMFSRLGTKVTLLQRSDRILPDQSPDLTDALSSYLETEGMNIVTGNNFQNINQSGKLVTVETLVNNRKQTFRAEKILIATGRKANSNNLGLETAEVKRDERGFIQVDDYLQTSASQIYAAGDVLGANMFVYTAAYEGKLAAINSLSGTDEKRDYTALPWVIFTDPQVAGVGLDEDQARANGIKAETSVLPLNYVPRSLAAKDTRGFIKLIRNIQTDKLIGARILAPEGSELLMEAAMSIKFGITVEQIKNMFHAYLTLGEGIKLAAIAFHKNVAELSCCAT